MHRIVAGGTGLIGNALIEHWLKQNYKITVIGRSAKKIANQFGNRVQAVEWQNLSADLFHTADIVINLAGVGVADRRWSAARKQMILQSRIAATEKIVALLAPLGANAPMLLNASAIGVYGLQPSSASELPAPLDENTHIDWSNAPDFLAEVARAWEKATEPAALRDVRVVNLRFGVVLAKQGGALPKMAMPFYFFMGGRVGSGCQPLSWVALVDVVRAIDFILAAPRCSGPINVVAPGAVTQSEFAKTLGSVLHKPSRIPTPAYVLQCVFGEMAHDLLLTGQHVVPRRLLDMGFQFSFPDIQSALRQIYAEDAVIP